MFSFVVNNDAEYYDQINMTALWDKFKKKNVLLQVEQVE